MSEENTFNISEDFYSVQGEGHTTGYPAYFIRLRSCNLMCGGSQGSLMKEGKATWWCDTEAVWKAGQIKPFMYLINRWKEQNILEWVFSGRIHLIWTGGEPALPKHQKAFNDFIYWAHEEQFNFREQYDIKVVNFYNEIETNGTLPLNGSTLFRLDQINCSPKLSNSGVPTTIRINPAAIESIMSHRNYWFKFVISTEEDVQEVQREYVERFNIPYDRVLMMPGLDSQSNFHERTRFCLEMAKKYGYVGLTRLHVSAWDKTTGV